MNGNLREKSEYFHFEGDLLGYSVDKNFIKFSIMNAAVRKESLRLFSRFDSGYCKANASLEFVGTHLYF